MPLITFNRLVICRPIGPRMKKKIHCVASLGDCAWANVEVHGAVDRQLTSAVFTSVHAAKKSRSRSPNLFHTHVAMEKFIGALRNRPVPMWG